MTATIARFVLALSLLVCLVGIIDAAMVGSWSVVVLFSATALLQAALVVAEPVAHVRAELDRGRLAGR